MGVEPTSLAWKASIIAVIRQSHMFVFITVNETEKATYD